MATTFHNFSALPPSNGYSSGTTLSDPPAQAFISSRCKRGPRPAPASLHVETKYVLASPTFTNGPPRPWREDNPSTYLVDAGLWAAQRESREVVRMNTALRLQSASQLTAEPAQNDWAHGVLPHQDIIYLQVALRKSIAIDKALFNLRHKGNPDMKAGTSTPVHIAFEYDTSWAYKNKGRMSDLEKRQSSWRCFMGVFCRVRRGRLMAKCTSSTAKRSSGRGRLLDK
ncbi:hypothetical protein ColTof3_11411 [Colletotrichum tofieldiae]|nr:hypothetical protein ColTof3_11411 [Colletotrichum tofieldiae]